MSKNVIQYFKRRHLIISLLSNSKISLLGKKFGSSNLIGKIKLSQKVKIYTNELNTDISGGVKNLSTYENVSICNDYHVSDISKIGGKIHEVG